MYYFSFQVTYLKNEMVEKQCNLISYFNQSWNWALPSVVCVSIAVEQKVSNLNSFDQY